MDALRELAGMWSETGEQGRGPRVREVDGFGALARHAARLVGQGVPPDSIAVVVPRRHRIAAAHRELCAAGAEGVKVGTPLDLARAVLKRGGAPMRVALDVELRVLLGDAGLDACAGLDAFARSAAAGGQAQAGRRPREGADARGEAAYKALRGRLDAYGAVAARELCARTALLLEGPGARGAAAAHLLVEGWGELSPDEARLCRVAAERGGLIVADDAGEGLTRAGVRTHVLKWDDPDQERQGIAELVQALLREDDSLDPTDVCIVAPTGAWARAMARELRRRRLSADMACGRQGIGGDPRSEERSPSLACLTKLRLALDGTDALAWRIWCALGASDLRGAEWRVLEQQARRRGAGVVELLAQAAAGRDEGLARACPGCAARYRQLAPQLEGLAHRRGFTLAQDLGLAGEAAQRLFGELAGDERAPEMLARIEARALDVGFDRGRGHVRVATWENARLYHPRVMVLASLVGEVPAAVEGRAAFDAHGVARVTDEGRNGDARLLRAAAGCARELLVLSRPRHMDADEARHLGCGRCRPVEGEVDGRGCVAVAPARALEACLEAWGDTLPPLQGGRQFLAEHLRLGEVGRVARGGRPKGRCDGKGQAREGFR